MTSVDCLQLKSSIKGTISQYSPKKWGYILSDDGEQYYFYWKDFSSKNDVRCVYEGARVEFEPGIDPKKGTHIARFCHLLDTSNITTYLTPEKIFESRSLYTNYWEVLELGRTKLKMQSSISMKDSLNKLKDLAQSFGANALLELVVEESFSENEQKQYCTSATPAVVGVKDVSANVTLKELKILNTMIELNRRIA